jgi:hypothetical protein
VPFIAEDLDAPLPRIFFCSPRPGDNVHPGPKCGVRYPTPKHPDVICDNRKWPADP